MISSSRRERERRKRRKKERRKQESKLNVNIGSERKEAVLAKCLSQQAIEKRLIRRFGWRKKLTIRERENKCRERKGKKKKKMVQKEKKCRERERKKNV